MFAGLGRAWILTANCGPGLGSNYRPMQGTSVNSLSNIRSQFNKKCVFLFKSSKELMLVVRSVKALNSGYPKR